ncbi:UNVERIFIED_ORG: hypothetical protein GGI66_003641 [Rhizobium esperanzae]
MKTCILAAAFFAAAAQANAFSQEQDQFLDQMAEAYLISTICPSLALPKTDALGLGLRLNKIDVEAAVVEINTRTAKDPWGIRKNPPDLVCLLGWSRYGSGGTKRKDLLHMKP